MRGLALVPALLSAALASAVPSPGQAPDPRDVVHGLPIPDESYCDQPRLVQLGDGTWVCVLTTGSGHEGSGGQHVVATRSTDRGRTWSPLVDVEPADPERPASYAVSYATPFDRVYAFYTYNGDAVHARPGPDGRPRDERIRADTMGWWCFRFSDDAGRSWSDRHRIPMRATACDRANDWGGEVQMFWAIGDPVTTTDGAVVFGFTKLRRHFLVDGEGWFWRSENLATERDPSRLSFELLPEGDHGLRHPDFGSVQEEFNVVPLPGGGLCCVYRTTLGFPAIAYSDDGGRTWARPEPMRARPDGPVLRNPRACPKLWHVGGGRYLFWFHNHGGRGFEDRNPAWLVAGRLRGGRLEFGQPEVLLYGADRSYRTGRFSYPDLLQTADGAWFVAETQKTVARIHSVDAALIGGMFAALDGEPPQPDPAGHLVAFTAGGGGDDEPPEVPDLHDLRRGAGYSIELELDRSRPLEGVLATAGGLRLTADPRESAGAAGGPCVTLHLEDAEGTAAHWTTDPLPPPGADGRTRIVLTVDGGPKLFTAVVDGRLDDGLADDGTSLRQRGFGWFDAGLGTVPGCPLQTAPAVRGLRVHGRALRTFEAVARSSR